MFIPMWLIVSIILAFVIFITPFFFGKDGEYDLGNLLKIFAAWFIEIIGYLIFWIIYLGFFI